MRPSIPSRVFKWALLIIGVGLICLAGGIYAFWYTVVYPTEVTPVAPIPTGAVNIGHTSDAATQARWYTDKYVVDVPIGEVEEFYKSRSYFCRKLDLDVPGIVVDNYLLTCTGDASPLGTFDVQIGRENASAGGKTLLVIEVHWSVAW